MRLPTALSREHGAVAVVVALLMVVFVGFSALVVDVGYNYTVKRQLQAAADAAALAGCQELIVGGSESEILAVARDYAEVRNAVRPADEISMVGVSPHTQVGADFVQVTVETTSTVFFGRALMMLSGSADNAEGMIRARARAQVAYATGVSKIVPLGLPLIRNPRVTATVAGGTETHLENYDASTGEWWSNAVPVPEGESKDGKAVKVTVYNNQTSAIYGTNSDPAYPDGVPMSLEDAASVSVRGTSVDVPPPAHSALLGVELIGGYVSDAGGETVRLRAKLTGSPAVKVQFGKPPMKAMELKADGWWESEFDVPPTDDPVTTYQVDIEADYGPASKHMLLNVAQVVSRRNTYPITNVQVTPQVVQGPGSEYVEVRARLQEYVFDQSGNTLYVLNLSSGANSWGNFQAIDLNELRHYDVHYATGPTEYPAAGGGGANAYGNFLATGYPNTAHIGDSVATKSAHGNMVGKTNTGLNTRFGSNTMTYLQWLVNRPPSPRVVFVPMLENISPESNNTPYRIVAFAAFYVEPKVTGQPDDEVRGHFIEYLTPSDSLDDEPPPGETFIMVPRLVVPNPAD